MKIKTISASDMRLGMRAIREQLGPEAVLLASERTDDGVLLTAAVDFDASQQSIEKMATIGTASARRAAATAPNAVDAVLGEELRVLRRMLETQVSQLAWNEYSRRSPLHAELEREFTTAGFDAALLGSVLDGVPESLAYSAARQLLMMRLADRLPAGGERWLQFGGRPVLLGSSGAGKTSTALRLAARWVQRHGNRDVALITTDTQGFAATEQFASQARLLGVPSYGVANRDEYRTLLDTLTERRLVVTDTAGLGGLDHGRELAGWRQLAAAVPQLEFLLVSSASVVASVQVRLLADREAPRFAAAVITKLDEGARIGALLSAFIHYQLPLSLVTRGRRWLQDLQTVQAPELIAAAMAAQAVPGACVVANEEVA